MEAHKSVYVFLSFFLSAAAENLFTEFSTLMTPETLQRLSKNVEIAKRTFDDVYARYLHKKFNLPGYLYQFEAMISDN